MTGPTGERELRDVDADADAGESQIFGRISGHILLAACLGIDPLTTDERATAIPDGACDGWPLDGRCLADGLVLDAPHSLSLRAQYHDDVLLLEHGLLDHEGSS